MIRVLQVAAVALTVSYCASEVRAVRADHWHGNMNVLTQDNFRSETAGPRPVLVYFYTNWCGHCKDSAPAYDELAAALRQRPGLESLTVANMDAEQHEDFLSDQGQTLYGYPTIRLYSNGQHADFEAERTVPKMLHWVERRVMGVKVIATREEVADFFELDSAVVVGFIKDPKSAAAEMLRSVARAMESLPIAMVSSQELMEEFDAEDGLVSIFTTFDSGRVDFHLAPTEGVLRQAIQRATTPLVVDFQAENARSALSTAQTPNQSVLVVYLSQRAGHYEQYVDVLRSIAMEHRNYTFLTVDADNAGSDSMFDLLGVKRSSVPCMRLLRSNRSEKYVPQSSRLSPKAIRAFLVDVNIGVIKPWVEGEDAPSDWMDKPVKVLVRSTFEQVVFDSRKHVLVMFYSETCPRCVALAPVYEQVAANLSAERFILVTKINALRNHVDMDELTSGVVVNDLPVVALYPRSSKRPVVFTGTPTTEDLLVFVRTHAHLGLTLQEDAEGGFSEQAPREPRKEL